jgi:hypothetical protein
MSAVNNPKGRGLSIVHEQQRKEVIAMSDKVRKVLETILVRFKSGDIPNAIAYSMNPVPDIPSARWSYLNKMVMYLSGTWDARGMRQWNRVGRTVKKGAKAIYILVPRVIKQRDYQRNEETRILKGFLGKPVFRVEDTEGDPLDYEKEIPLPELPLLERAKEWGITVTGRQRYTPYLGFYDHGNRHIELASPEESVFFHELAHAAHARLNGGLRDEPVWKKEVVAELSAQALCHLVGKKPQDWLGNSYRYIEKYAQSASLTPISACLRLLDTVERVLTLILGKEESNHVEHTN